MPAEIFLIADAAQGAALLPALEALLGQHEVAALLLLRGNMPDSDYFEIAKTIIPVAQAAGTAVLLEGEPAIVRRLGADGLHLEGSVAALKSAIAELKPDFIVGSGPVSARHDAMTRGELGVDYIQFGPTSGSISPEVRELAHWWAETMEVPSVLSDPEATFASYEAEGCEFIGLRLPMPETP